MSGGSPAERVVGLWRVQDGRGERLLILDREPQYLRILDGALRSLLRGRYDKVAQRPALKLGSAADNSQRLR